MSKDASQHGRQVSQQSKVMVKPTTHLRKIHTYIYINSYTCIHKKRDTYNIQSKQIAVIQYNICMKCVGSCYIKKCKFQSYDTSMSDHQFQQRNIAAIIAASSKEIYYLCAMEKPRLITILSKLSPRQSYQNLG